MELEHVYQCLLFTHRHAQGGFSYSCEAFPLACVYFSSRLSAVS